MILPWNRCRTETRIESKSVGSRQKLANSESNEPLLGAWQTGHSFGSTKQLWQVKCPQLVNEPGTISSPAPQTCLKQFWRKSETNHVPMTKKKIWKNTFLARIRGNHFRLISISHESWWRMISNCNAAPERVWLRLQAWLPALEYFRALASANFVAFATSHCRGHARS